MKTIQIVFHDAGGGHRNAALALQKIIAEQQRPWNVQLVHMQEILDDLDWFRQLTGIRTQECYNNLLQNGWTLGSTWLLRLLQATIRVYHRAALKRLRAYWQQHPGDLLISVVPHFNRVLRESWRAVHGAKPFVTILTDLADFPPHFWIERQEQHFVCGTDRAVEQVRQFGGENARVSRVSGMILRPEFYAPDDSDPLALRREMGLREDLPAGIVLFGGQGSKAMYEITERLDAAGLPIQLILICGKNAALAAKLRARSWRMPVHVMGFTTDVHRIMRAADFFIGKPGPGSISEAMTRGLPVIIACNAWTLPQERYNAEWVREKRVGVVLKNFRGIAATVAHFLEAGTLAQYRANARALENRAVFEIADLLAQLLAAEGPAVASSEPGNAPAVQACASA
ncbi:MAG: galactosyldiacylglycerol synthase [Acidobacteriia bacterium]|nr:galactosyldiacylglycerol synthase [Terriglobia bacterium]